MKHWSCLTLAALLTVLACCSAHYEWDSYYRGPIYSRRLDRSQLRRHYDYARRYAENFYRRFRDRRTGSGSGSGSGSGNAYTTAIPATSQCLNQLALPNGSYIGRFNCPFLPDEDPTWTRCCGYPTERFCCENDFDDSWAYEKHWMMWMILSGVGVLLALIAVVISICAICKRKGKARVLSEVNLKKSPVPVQSVVEPPSASPLPLKVLPVDPDHATLPPQSGTPTRPYPPPRYSEDGSRPVTPASLRSNPPPYSVDTQ